MKLSRDTELVEGATICTVFVDNFCPIRVIYRLKENVSVGFLSCFLKRECKNCDVYFGGIVYSFLYILIQFIYLAGDQFSPANLCDMCLLY